MPCFALPPARSWRRGLLSVILFAGLAGTLPVGATTAARVRPFPTRNQSPIIQIFGLPFAESAVLTRRRHLQVQFSVQVANNFTSGDNPTEAITLDGETYRLTGSFRYGLSERLELGLDVPYVIHRGGNFDTFIDFWHDTFFLPDSGRSEVPENRLLYGYNRRGRTEFFIEDDTAGFGDVVLNVGWHLYREPAAPRDLSLRLNLKLPSGGSTDLRGSGSTDVALRLVGADRGSLAAYRIGLFGSLGVLGLTTGDVLPGQQRHVVGFGSLGLGWGFFSWLLPKLQLNWHSPFFDHSGLREIAAWSAQLTVGGTLRFGACTSLDLAISEDVAVSTSPDIVFHATLRHVF